MWGSRLHRVSHRPTNPPDPVTLVYRKALRPGSVVADRYQIDERVGEGGMGVVFRASDLQTGVPVAVKVLAGQGHTEVRRFEREAGLLSQLDHPAIVRYITRGVAPTGERFLVMSWVEGQTLAERLAGDGFAVADTVALGIRLADALACAHASGVLHRDLKPGNVILPSAQADDAVLIDFGIARRRHDVEGLTATGVMVGTPSYMSPEQARSDRVLTPSADIFGLGCLLYECLTGRPPFGGGFWMTVRLNVLLADPPALEGHAREAPPALVALVERMLAKDPGARPASVAEVADQLRALGVTPSTTRATRQDPIESPTAAIRGRPMRTLADTRPRSFLILVLADEEDDDEDEERESYDDELLGRLCEVVAAAGGELTVLADRAICVCMSADDSDAVLAARAARCVLELRELLPDNPMSLSHIGAHGAVSSSLGPALDATLHTLVRSALGAIFTADARMPILIDDATAEALAAEFTLQRGDGATLLVG